LFPNSDFGISVDIGTTHLTIRLVRLIDQHLILEKIIINPQIAFGLDIISRAGYAVKKRENAVTLTTLVRSAVQDEVDALLKQAKISGSSVRQMVIVGNAVMHHLFFDLPLFSLVRAPYVAEKKSVVLTNASDLGFATLPDAECYSPPLIESFIGADAPAVMLASNFLNSKTGSIAIDVGTNTEIIVRSSKGIWIASAASGPAFEGMSIEYGMLGQNGAISRVEIDHRTLKPKLSVLGAEKPQGICGTGAISSLAAMLDAGILLPNGSFNRSLKSRWLNFEDPISHYILADEESSAHGRQIVISQPDVRMLQQSKAAIRGVINVLLHESDLASNDVEFLYITGVFGTDLDVRDAYRIGLLPRFPNAMVQQKRNSASIGAEMLFSEDNRVRIEHFLKEVTYIEMSDNPAFKEQFFASIPFSDQ
jgi:uncharacterized 2Fe-2S/4Fe-4S cluster protein (DUF4445 family)